MPNSLHHRRSGASMDTSQSIALGPALRRRGWVIPVIAALAACAAIALATLRPTEYSSVSRVVVTEQDASPDQRSKLAATYAAALPVDDRIVGLVSRATGESSWSRIRDQLQVVNTEETGLLTLSYTAEDAESAQRGVGALHYGVTGRSVSTSVVEPGTLRQVSAPSTPEQGGSGATTIGILGGLVGLGLGALVLIAWERRDQRLDAPEHLSDLLRVPVSRIGRSGAEESVEVLCVRWSEITERDEPRVLLLAATRPASRGLHTLEERFSQAGERLVAQGRLHSAPRVETGSFASAAQMDDAAGVELRVLDADLVVLVARAADRSATVAKEIARLRTLGAAPGWALFIDVKADSSPSAIEPPSQPTGAGVR